MTPAGPLVMLDGMRIRFPDATRYGSLLDLIDEAATLHADEEAVALVGDDGHIVTWDGREFRRRVDLVAWRLRALGLQPGHRLLTWGPSSPSLAAVYAGALRAGVVLVPLDLRMAADVVERIAARSGAHWLAVATGRDAPDPREVSLPEVRIRTVEALVAEPPDLPPQPIAPAGPSRAADDPDEPAEVAFPPDWREQVEAWPRPTRESLLEVMYTSGTTGKPKGAMLSHGNLLGTIEAAGFVIPHQRHRLVSVLPLSHLFGQLELFYALYAGAPILYVRSRNPRVIFDAIRAHRVTTMVVVPQVLDLFWCALTREV